LRQDGAALAGNLEGNNSLNVAYKKRLLAENHKLGLHPDKLQTVDQVRQVEAVDPEAPHAPAKLIKQGSYPAQLRRSNKQLVEAQNFTIKQPTLSGGDVFDHRPPQDVLHRGKPMNAMFFTQLNFRDKMMDQRATKYPNGNEYLGVETPLKSRVSPQALESTNRLMSKTIDVMGAVPENDEDGAVNQSQSPRELQQHLYRQLRGKGEYRKNKYDGENAKFTMGSFDRKRGSTTDYRQSFTWVVPKYS
jgi:hypothetical protein